MKLITYLEKVRGRQSWLAEQLGTVDACVHDWKTGKAPIPVKMCVKIEKVTKGKVTRKELRSDWADIWPELRDGKTWTQNKKIN